MSFYETNAEQNDYFYFIHLKKESETPPICTVAAITA